MRFPIIPLTLAVLFFGWAAAARAQVTVTEIRETNSFDNGRAYIFPLIRVPGNAKASDSINNQLASEILQIERKKIKKSIFENVWKTPMRTIPMATDLSYDVLANSPRLFSLSISGEGCGAYCESFTYFFSFNPLTGEQLTTGNLFTEQGQVLLRDSLKKKQLDLLDARIKNIRDTLAKNLFTSVDDKTHFEDVLDLYSRCRESRENFNLDYLRFYITKTSLFVSVERCSAHVNRALDDLAEFNIEFNLADWKAYYTPFLSSMLK